MRCPFCGSEELTSPRGYHAGEEVFAREKLCSSCGNRFYSEERLVEFYVMNPVTLRVDRMPLTPDNVKRFGNCMLNRDRHPDYSQRSFEEF